MKRFLSSLIMLTIIVAGAFGQSDHGYNIYGQIAGASMGYGIGFDSRFKKNGILGYSGGIGFINTSWSESSYRGEVFRSSDIKSKGASIPLEINAIFGKRASKFEVGLGFTAYLVNKDEITIVMTPDGYGNAYHEKIVKDKSSFRPNIAGTINMGYRLQRKSGFFMRLGLTIFIGDVKCSPIDGMVPLPNLCFGYTIPHFK